jgi:hypothetical protein
MDLKEGDSFGSGHRPVVSSCEFGNEPLGSKNVRVFLNYLSAY